jgi:hypothetical protein
MNRCWTRATRALGLAVAVSLALASSAWADDPAVTADTAETCSDPTLEQPFSTLGDSRDYVLAPGGAFADPAAPGWSLDGGASVVSAADPFGLGAVDDAYSLSLPAGASATSPMMCVDLHFPTMRFVGAQTAERDGDLDVEVLYPGAEDEKKRTWHKSTSLKLKSKDGWQVSRDIKMEPDRAGKKAGWRMVALRFSAEDDKGSWLVDDIYVDPRMK